MYPIPFNRPYVTGKEWEHIQAALAQGKLSSNGKYTQKCQHFFESRFGFKKTFLTHSCTQALEMAALLLNLGPEDEVILPSYSYVSTANAFALRGCRLVFADSRPDYPGIDEAKIENLISSRTRALVLVHYGGVACHMEPILDLCKKYGLFLIEDAAAALDGYYLAKDGDALPLGSMGDFATFSFHETKNISCGEGGLLVVNNPSFFKEADLVWNRGTNRSEFEMGHVLSYEWVRLGSAFAPSEITAAWLWSQLENLAIIQEKRAAVWNWYQANLKEILATFFGQKPVIPLYARQNYNTYYLVMEHIQDRDALIDFLKSRGILSVSHYRCLHQSPYFKNRYQGKPLLQAEKYQERLLRLPVFADLDVKSLENSLLS
ncbi:dTDP-4-amino-4,6-dideoxygalactose transaminase [Cyclobacterium jeungdonense]|uniref:dTDP-4-amino-4,6-dideoxygalactose transaminase n=1 Tax=Cyclobacterium jeungdonense TaxID=708087 RepID=A0ABT8C639_9BACT|nr:dTDP-4-amino-4,6-dideoxygalactose transaminase [Cyclobacterium jeungdonense]MDN3687842.1 dTDP-4-amino-4,6-dideoxygalactose transaminase [Cyclobacterium jeungdonense]